MNAHTINKSLIVIIFTAALFLPFSACSGNREKHVSPVINHITSTRQALKNTLVKGESARFITFWDFDGTIQKGDCTEGLTVDGKKVFTGLAEKTINAGLSSAWPPGKYPLFEKKAEMLNKKDHISYLLFFPRALEGKKENEIISFSEKYFQSTLQHYFFDSSLRIIDAFKKQGILVYVISASADVYVRGAASVLGIPRSQVRGIVMKSRKGCITSTPERPVTYGPGKTKVMENIVARLKSKGKGKVFVLAGFGNSYSTDGDFLARIAEMKLPAGKTLSVMINGGKTPPRYKNLFLKVKQEKTGATHAR